jgi:hypothetical protein
MTDSPKPGTIAFNNAHHTAVDLVTGEETKIGVSEASILHFHNRIEPGSYGLFAGRLMRLRSELPKARE